MNAYCRYEDGFPITVNGAIAIDGFNKLGIKNIPFTDITKINPGPEALVHGHIKDVFNALTQCSVPIPESIDYPDELKDFYERKIWTGKLEDLKHYGDVFVKPQQHKLFNGMVCGRKNIYLLALFDPITPCYFSDIVKFVSEYRCFVLDGEILGVHHYAGDWTKIPNKYTVEGAVRDYQEGNHPIAYAIDFGITEHGETLIVEVNDGFALGAYGLPSAKYARLLEARWESFFNY